MEVLLALPTRGEHEYLFVNSQTGRPYVTLAKQWDRIRKLAGVPFLRIHDLRHAFAPFLVSNGVSLWTVSTLLGRSDPKISTRYAHLTTKALVLCLIATIAGCTSTTREWQEEVQLSDGTVLEVHRTIRFEKASGAIGQPRGDGWICDGEDLSFVDPGTGRVIEWSGHRRTAALLDRIDGQYVIVAAQTRCEFEDRGRSIWRVYVLTQTGWSAGIPTGLSNYRTPNFALDSRGYSKTKGWSRLTIAQKPQLDAASRIGRELKTIDLNDPTKCH